jgi:hypothetical protein
MKKLITLLSIVLALHTTVALAQAKTAAKPAAKTAAKAPAKGKMSKADSLMCGKDWRVVAVTEWNIEARPPAARNKNDMLKLSLDGTYNMVMFDTTRTGTWIRSGQSLTFKGVAGFFKIVVQEPGKLKLDHFDSIEGHSIFEYEPKKD